MRILKKNPGPKPNSYQSFSICHWNLNSISAHNFLKLSLLRAYITFHKFDVICLSKNFLDSFILHDDNNLQIPGYNLQREDNSLNVKRGGVFISYNIFLPLIIIWLSRICSASLITLFWNFPLFCNFPLMIWYFPLLFSHSKNNGMSNLITIIINY